MLATKNYTQFSIVSDTGSILAQFEGATLAGKALPGDLVEQTETGCRLLNRTNHPALVGIVQFNSKTKYGFTSRNIPIYLFIPYNESYPPFLVGSSLRERTNQIGIATFEQWEGTTFPRGSLQRILGTCGQESLEKEALALHASPFKQRMKDIPMRLELPSKEGRVLLDVPTINIDPEGCRDIDDVISLWPLGDGEAYRCAISISDVAAYFAVNPFMKFAEKIGQTLYQDGAIVRPMFDMLITENLLSLTPGEERLAVSLLFTWRNHKVEDLEWKETIIRNKASYSYESCYQAKEINMRILKEICSALGEDTTDSHKWIETLMIFYNTEAAKILVQKGQGLLRAHDAPHEEKLALYEKLGLPAKELAFPAASYVPVGGNTKHWGLGKEVYCHASSPIRRFADILNQLVLKGCGVENCEHYAYRLNTLQKAMKQHDRDYFFMEQLFQNTTRTIEGIVVGKKVYIPEWKRFVSIPTETADGSRVTLRFYARMGERNWKNRIVFELL